MKQKNIFLVWSVFYLMFGINLLVIPNQFMTLFGSPLDQYGILVGRVFGSALVSLFVLYYFLRNISQNNIATKAIILVSLIFNVLVAPVMAHATITGVMNNLGWLPVMVNVVIFASSVFLLYKYKKYNDAK